MSVKNLFVNVITKAQQEGCCHKKLMKIIENSFDISNLELFSDIFKKCLMQLYLSDAADKNPFVARGLEFLAKLALKITLNCIQPQDVTNPNGTLSRVYDVTTDPFFTTLLKFSLKHADVEKPETRFNTCYFIMALLQNIGNNVEMDYSLCDSVYKALVGRLEDPKVNVCLQALRALFRIQEPSNPECIVMKSFFLLFWDPSCEVRKTVVSLIAPHPRSFAKIIERLSDVDNGVKQAVYKKWSDTNPRLFLKIIDRNFILTCAFQDENKKIKQILTEKLLPKWLIAYNGNYLELLKGLKLDADENDITRFEDLCTQVMGVYLNMNPLADIVKHLPIDKEEKIIPLDRLHLEVVLYWSILIKFLRDREDADDYLESILPELSPFSNYLERIVREKSASSMDEYENLEYQNVVFQLFEIASGFDMSDEAGRRTLYSLIIQILSTYKFHKKVLRRIISVASLLNSNMDSFTTDICQVISDIREPLIDDIPSAGKLKERNFEVCQMKVKILELEMAEEEALKKKDFQHAHIVHNELIDCQRQLDNLTNSHSNTEKVRVSKDDPETLCRCLDILTGLLKTAKVNKMTPALRTCMDEFLMPILTNDKSEVHRRCFLCLGLFSIIDKETALSRTQFISFPIATYRTIPNPDKTLLKISVGLVADLIRVHGVKVLGIDDDACSVTSQDQNQTTNRRKLYTENMDELQIVNKDISIELIIEILLDMLDDEDEEVGTTACCAINKLMIHDFPVSSELICRLILKWFNPLTARKSTKLQHLIGKMISVFGEKVKGARKIVEQAVIPIISSLVNAPRTSPLIEVDTDNVIRFLSALTNTLNTDETENIHNSLALTIIDEISKNPEDDCMPLLAKLLTYLKVDFIDPAERRSVISKTELLLVDILEKGPNKSITKFLSNLKRVMSTVAEEDETKVDQSQAVTEASTLTNNETNLSEGNSEVMSISHKANGSKVSIPATINSSIIPSDKNQGQEQIRKRVLYEHDNENESTKKGKKTQEDNNKGSQRLSNKQDRMNPASRQHLSFSSSSEETIYRTFLQGDEELQVLEDISIEDVTSRSNSSGDSKKENVSLDTSTSSSSLSKLRSSNRRRTRTKDSAPTTPEVSPKRKILRTNPKRVLQSVAH